MYAIGFSINMVIMVYLLWHLCIHVHINLFTVIDILAVKEMFSELRIFLLTFISFVQVFWSTFPASSSISMNKLGGFKSH